MGKTLYLVSVSGYSKASNVLDSLFEKHFRRVSKYQNYSNYSTDNRPILPVSFPDKIRALKETCSDFPLSVFTRGSTEYIGMAIRGTVTPSGHLFDVNSAITILRMFVINDPDIEFVEVDQVDFLYMEDTEIYPLVHRPR